MKLLCDGKHYEEAIREARGATENLGTLIITVFDYGASTSLTNKLAINLQFYDYFR